ncbi:hypothetical protein N9W12_06835 [Luminiphilus sp.]|nr:hypothetical protein [Luminiphilus sp.]
MNRVAKTLLNLMRIEVLLGIGLVLWVTSISGCASEDQMRSYALGRSIDDRILALNLTDVTETEVDMIPVGQLVTSEAAIFTSSDGEIFLITFGASLSGYRYQGQEVYLDGYKFSSGDSMVSLEDPAVGQNNAQGWTQSNDAAPSAMIPFERTLARVGRVFQLRNQKHAQEVADSLGR